MNLGATFSEPYALSLGLDPPEVLRAIARDLALQPLRLCTYWDRTERQAGHFDFQSLDWQIEDTIGADLDIILTVGQKAPRWPEFYVPSWTSRLAPDFEQHLLRFIDATVRRFRDAPISVWQVENEPYVSFGGPPIDDRLLRREIDVVRSLDARPVMLTESAAKRDWRRAARCSDILGVNLYARVWRRTWTNPFLGGYMNIAVPASRYNRLRRKVSPSLQDVIVAELQAEPWGPKPVTGLTPAETARTMTPDRLRRNVALATDAGFTTALLWGAEWWYYQRQRGDPSMWNAVTSLVQEST
jgi:hypothetical protein